MTVAEYTTSVERFVALHRSVADLQRSAAFYCQALGFEVVDKAAHEIMLALDAQRIVLVQRRSAVTVPQVPGPDVRFQHVAIVAADMEAAFTRLQAFAPVAISRGGPQRLPAASGGVCAFKFRDPDGHALELIEFPPGQGAPCWRNTTRGVAGPTLGIDHAAISVSNVDLSIAFYERLGFSVQSRQLNRGPEQARLDGLDDAEVEVVTLTPSQESTPHLELLGYRAPEPWQGGGAAQAAADALVWHAPAGQPMELADPDGHLHQLLAASN